ncbi:MAG: YncE family protein [Gaiellaceae bacterium]
MTLAAGEVWVVVEGERNRALLWELDARSGKRLASYTIGKTGPDFGAVAARRQVVYAAAGEHVMRVDLAHPSQAARAALPGDAAAMTAGSGSVWVATIGRRDAVTRFAASPLAARTRIPLTFQPVALQTALGSVWLASTAGLWRIEGKRLFPAPVAMALPAGLATANARLWLLQQDDQIASVDPSGRVRARIRLPFSPGSFAVSGRRIWVTDNCGCATGRLALLDLASGRRTTIRLGRTPVAVAAASETAWVASFGDRTLWRVSERG